MKIIYTILNRKAAEIIIKEQIYMRDFINKHLTAIIAAAFALIVVIVLAVVLISGNNEKNPGTENPGTEVSTEIGTESTEVVGDVEDTETTEVVTPEVPSTEDTGTSETPTPQPSETPEPQKPAYTFTEMNKTMYAKSNVNVRALPLADGEKVGSLSKGQAVTVTGQCNETGWYRIDLNGTVAYVSNNYLVDNKPVEETPAPPSTPDVPSGGGENEDTNIEEDNGTASVNGFTIEKGAAYEHNKELAEAGLYAPVYDSETNRYFMLIKDSDNKMQYTAQLREYIAERGGVGGAGGGNYAGIFLNGERLYQIYVFVE